MNDLKQNYFDFAATGIPCEAILQAALLESTNNFGNPSSAHSLGKTAKQILENAREKIASTFAVENETIYFTSGGTESNQLVLLSLLSRPQKGSVLISSIEHPAVREQAKALQLAGWHVDEIPVTSDGFVDECALSKKITNDLALVCVMLVNNETGAVQNILKIKNTIKTFSKRDVHFHVDAVQGLGKIPFTLSDLQIDSAAFSAHKIGGARGSGLLYLRKPLQSFLRGGGQEKNMRSGTENIFGAISFASCIEKYHISEKNKIAEERFLLQKKLTHNFAEKLLTIKTCELIPKTRMENEEHFSPWILQASFKNIPGQVMVRALDANGFYISTGSACSSAKASRPILEAMNVPKDVRETSVRFSFGFSTSEDAMNNLFDAVKKITDDFR